MWGLADQKAGSRADRTDTLDYNSHGWFRVGPPAFSIEAGESCWAETVSSFHEVEHSIVIRALRKGQYIIDAFVAAPLDTDSVLGNNASIVLNIN